MREDNTGNENDDERRRTHRNAVELCFVRLGSGEARDGKSTTPFCCGDCKYDDSGGDNCEHALCAILTINAPPVNRFPGEPAQADTARCDDCDGGGSRHTAESRHPAGQKKHSDVFRKKCQYDDRENRFNRPAGIAGRRRMAQSRDRRQLLRNL